MALHKEKKTLLVALSLTREGVATDEAIRIANVRDDFITKEPTP